MSPELEALHSSYEEFRHSPQTANVAADGLRSAACSQFAFSSPAFYFGPVKTMQLSIRDCPDHVRRTLKQSAQQNRRSLAKEALTWLEKEAQARKPVTGRQWAERLRKARKLLTEKEHSELAKDIQTSRRLMNREHLR